MTKEQKLAIINGLIEQAEKATYKSKAGMRRCIDDSISFIRNTMSDDSPWINRINSIKWNPSYASTDSSIYNKF